MSVESCELELRETANLLRSVLEPLGFEFQFSEAAQGYMAFASGFFIQGGLKIGLIYRVNYKLGAVVYENETTNVLHDRLLVSLGLAAKQRLRYDKEAMASVALDGGDVVDALRADLLTLTPVLRDREALSRSISKARDESDRADKESEERKAAKLRDWLRRRSEKD